MKGIGLTRERFEEHKESAVRGYELAECTVTWNAFPHCVTQHRTCAEKKVLFFGFNEQRKGINWRGW